MKKLNLSTSYCLLGALTLHPLLHRNVQLFMREVNETISRGVRENILVSQVVFEIKSLRLSYDVTFMDAVHVIFSKLLEDIEAEWAVVWKVLKKWKDLLCLFATDVDDQLVCLFWDFSFVTMMMMMIIIIIIIIIIIFYFCYIYIYYIFIFIYNYDC